MREESRRKVRRRQEEGEKKARGKQEEGEKKARGKQEEGEKKARGKQEEGRRKVRRRQEEGEKKARGKQEEGRRKVRRRQEEGEKKARGKQEEGEKKARGKQEEGEKKARGKQEEGRRKGMCGTASECPMCLKTMTIVPVPKMSTDSCLDDYCPVALTPIVMKCFERLVMRHIKTQLPPSLDPLQFAYHLNHSTDDAITTTLHLALTHLDNKDSYIRMLFINFSSAFNTIIPQHLIEKLSLLGLNISLCNWTLDFLRPQSVRIRNSISNTTTLSTGAPQGCVLSPLLFTLLTHDCAAMHSLNHIIKLADDMAVDMMT
ncbi:hypothetical protein QTP70_010116 [Hemibagrus guttatus]|uniref:Reverse transcriptase domain-containing protein n=1 Tax=Hemibagrus guttatus TaxID=175788 RepID=A0AAE0VD12_9TELE|nr:hypothetical protein QTP70_010116 [Hemibagrus guttatus]